MKNTKIIRADIVGSMLRPAFLLEAQEQLKNGNIMPAALTRAEDKAIKEAVAIQEITGVDVVTDGEMRRPVFCHNFVKAVDGFQWNIKGNTVIWFDMQGNKVIDPVTVGVVKKIQKIHDISIDEFSFLRGITDKPKKITIPSPTMISYYFARGISDKIYPRPLRFLREVLDPLQQEWFASKGFDPKTLVHDGVEMINEVLSNFHGLKALHICRGNDKNRFMARGGYEAIAQTVFKKARVDRLLLEFDSDRAGDFTPLRHVPKGKIVVLGLITTKSSILENKKAVIERIKEASRFIPLERLAISTQCGFASVAKGNNLTFDDQKAKLKLVANVAKHVWKE